MIHLIDFFLFTTSTAIQMLGGKTKEEQKKVTISMSSFRSRDFQVMSLARFRCVNMLFHC